MMCQSISLLVVASLPSFIWTLRSRPVPSKPQSGLKAKLGNVSSSSSASLKNSTIWDPRTAVLVDAKGTPLANAEDELTNRLKPPAAPEVPYNLVNPSTTYYSQLGQDKFVDTLLNYATGGFFIEAGAYNGEDHSNTLFFEKTRGWQGLLFEPNPYLFQTCFDKKRKAYLLNAGISPTGQPSSFPFKLAGPLGGISENYTAEHEARANNEIAQGQPWMEGEKGSGRVIQVPCFPLEMVLGRLGKTTVDYLSLDVEGAEPRILQSINFQNIVIGVMSIEHNGNAARRTAINDILLANGFTMVQDGSQDFIYANQAYLNARKR